MLDFAQLIESSRIQTQLLHSSKKRVLDALSSLLSEDPDAALTHMDILDALSARERLGSTGLGHGIALPHGRLANIEKPTAALITLKTGIPFDAPDDENVDIFVALLMPENCDDQHLKTLAELARHFSQEKVRTALREAKEATDVLAIFANGDSNHPEQPRKEL